MNNKTKLPEINYRELFLKAANQVYSDIYTGVTDIEGALDVLRGILIQKNLDSKLIRFEKK